MAKRWVKDEFNTAGDLQGAETNTGQIWGEGTGTTLNGFYPEVFDVSDGKAYLNGTYPGELSGYYQYCRNITVPLNTLNTSDTNVYEWWLTRFPVSAGGTPNSLFYQPAEALLVYESRYTTEINAIRVQYDPLYNKMRVSSPAESANTGSSYGMLEPDTWYEPLPALNSGSHPAEYYFKLTTTETGLTLRLNNAIVFEDAPRGTLWPNGKNAGIGCSVGRNIGLPGANLEPYIGGTWNFAGVIEFTEFRVNYTATDGSKPPLHQLYRTDGQNGTGPWQYSARNSRGSGPLWQYGGTN